MEKYRKFIEQQLASIAKTKENVVAQLNTLLGAEDAFMKMLAEIDGKNEKEGSSDIDEQNQSQS